MPLGLPGTKLAQERFDTILRKTAVLRKVDREFSAAAAGGKRKGKANLNKVFCGLHG